MRGHLHKDARTGSYWVVTSHVDPVTGKRKRSWDGPHRLKKEAERRRVEILAAIQTGGFVEASKLTVAGYLVEVWLPSKRDRVRVATLLSYEGYCNNYVIPQLGGILLQKLSPGDLSRFYAKLTSETQSPRNKPLSPATVRRLHFMLFQALAEAETQSLIVRNPAAQVKSPRASSGKRVTTWTPTELTSFLDSVEHDRLVALWRLLATSGARRGEIIGLRHGDIDLNQGTATISQSLVLNYTGTATSFNPPKTAAGARTIDLDRTTITVLKAHRARQIEERLAAGAAWRNEHDLVFTDELGQPLNPNFVSKRFASLVRRSGLPRIRLHDLRHGWASMALRAGVHPRVVQQRLGHSSIAITLGTYSHVAPGMGREAGDLVASLMDGGR